MNAPPSSGHDCSCGSWSIVVVSASTGPLPTLPRQHRPGRPQRAERGQRLRASPLRIGLQLDQPVDRIERIAEQVAASARCVPNRLPTIGKRQPLTRAK